MNFNKNKKLKKEYDIILSKQNLTLKKLMFFKKKSLGFGLIKGIKVRHRGGGHKRKYRLLNNTITPETSTFLIRKIEYDPNRNTFISLNQQKDGTFFYTLAPSFSKENDIIKKNTDYLAIGNYEQLKNIPLGIKIFNIQNNTHQKFAYTRSAGTFAQIIKKDDKYAFIKLPSGKIKKFNLTDMAMIGTASNIFFKFHKKYKAGTNRFLNKRPKVRGVAMNPIDHPHGGGEGKTSGGRPSVSIWGNLTKGGKKTKK